MTGLFDTDAAVTTLARALMRRSRQLLLIALTMLMIAAPAARGADAPKKAEPQRVTTPADADAEVPLVIGNRTIHVFRAALGEFSASERANAARRRVEQALDAPGDGWTSIVPDSHGVVVALDGKPMFSVAPGDAQSSRGETPEQLANQASRTLQQVWSESRERRAPGLNVEAILWVGVAIAALCLALWLLTWLARHLRRFIAVRLAGHLERLSGNGFASHIGSFVLGFAARISGVLIGLVGLLAIFVFSTYALGQFALTRPISEQLSGSLTSMLYNALMAAAQALPGLFVAVIIFMIARIATQVSKTLFARIESGELRLAALDAHTAPATRMLVNAAIWLFALAMSYPYLPGSHTEAFKGLSVLIGVMVSIGASGLIGQIASGMILIYTRALMVGEYVHIQNSEGTVTHIGLCVTRLQTGSGEEVALPNSLVIGQVTRNLSRNVERGGYILDTSVTIGYDTPWRQVHAMLLEAARRIPGARAEPAPFVMQTALSDFYVEYRLILQMGAETRTIRPRVLSDLNAAVQDVFNQYGVQIMSPNYRGDPEQAKFVPVSEWYRAPAVPDGAPRRD